MLDYRAWIFELFSSPSSLLLHDRHSAQDRVMGCLRFTVTVVVTLVSLISMEDFLILAHRDLNKNNIVILKSDEGLARAKQWYRERRMVIEESEEGKKSSMKQRTGANPSSERKCGHGEEKEPSVGCELRSRIHPSSRLHFAGLIPFSADYRAPKNHPPKNN